MLEKSCEGRAGTGSGVYVKMRTQVISAVTDMIEVDLKIMHQI